MGVSVLLETTWTLVLASERGPFSARFVIQPLLALLLGLRDAKLDVAAGAPPYVIGLLRSPGDRRERLKEGAIAVAKPFAVSVVLDAIVQWLVAGRVGVLAAFGTGLLLIGVPYVLARGLGNRALR